MKHIKLLLIINIVFLIISCKNETKEYKDEDVKVQTVKNDTLVNQKDKDTIAVILEVEDTTKIKQEKLHQDSVQNENIKEVNTLEVIIDGKVYYKINKNDVVVKGNKYHYYNKKEDWYYDIRTGRSVYIYGKHGKVMKK